MTKHTLSTRHTVYRIAVWTALLAVLLTVGMFLGKPSPASAATVEVAANQATFTLNNGVQSYEDTTPGGLALKELFKAASIVVQSGKATGLINLPISLTYGGKPLTGTAALSLTGSYEDATGLLEGTYYYEYDIVYTTTLFGLERQVGAYNGTVEAGVGANAKTASLLFRGSWTVTHYSPAPGGGWRRGQPGLGLRCAPCDVHVDRDRARARHGARGVQRHRQDKDLARWRRHVD